jgi:16S rRNA (cytidine1402-2'-O)-methyltransferase
MAPSPKNPRQAISQSRTYTVHGQMLEAPPLSAGLYIVATPIGNLRDITLRALETLAACDTILAEDTRVSRKLLQAYGIKSHLIPYHDHSDEGARARVLKALEAGEAIALISDAGTPLISDPGFKLVRDVAKAGHALTALPGASSLLAGLVLSALPTHNFVFAGFLPSTQSARRAALQSYKDMDATLVFFESGNRLSATLSDAALMLGNRDGAVARELTKLFEEVVRGPIPDLAQSYEKLPTPKGEIVLMIAPPVQGEGGSEVDIAGLLKAKMQTLSLKEAVAQVTAQTGLPRKTVYAAALALPKEK